MISSKRAYKISFERDKEKRNTLVDKLTEEDAKNLLKVVLSVINGEGRDLGQNWGGGI